METQPDLTSIVVTGEAVDNRIFLFVFGTFREVPDSRRNRAGGIARA